MSVPRNMRNALPIVRLRYNTSHDDDQGLLAPGAMRGIELAASRQAIAEARQRWLPILETCAKRNDDGVDEHVHAEIRRLRRLLGLPPADPAPGVVERRRRLVRERVRRFRERQANLTDSR